MRVRTFPSKETREVFLDLSKALDIVWYEWLIYKLKCSDISGDLLLLIKTSLDNRQQRVVVNGKLSSRATVSAGVLSGSIFLPYLNKRHC